VQSGNEENDERMLKCLGISMKCNKTVAWKTSDIQNCNFFKGSQTALSSCLVIMMKNKSQSFQRCSGSIRIAGQGHQRAIEIAEAIRQGVESLSCEYKNIQLPKVTASIGIATAPPEERKFEIETLAESRKRQAKEKGKNQVIAV